MARFDPQALGPAHAARRACVRGRRRGGRASALPWTLLLACLAAQPARAAEPKPQPMSPATLRSELTSGDDARAARALEALGASKLGATKLGAREALDLLAPLDAFVREGQPDALADAAITAIGALRRPEALPLLERLVRHRRASARIAAFGAVGAIPGDAALALLVAGLGDGDPAVRGACARLLGERGDVRAVEPLFVALERGVPEAAPAIGALGDGAAVTRMHGLLGRLPLDVLLAGYERFLARADLDEAGKLDVVARLGEVAAVAVKRFLEQQLAAGVAVRSPRLAHALRETARRIEETPRPGGGRRP